MSTVDYKRTRLSGRGIPVPGNDIDTDRIIPARFLKAVTFEGMGEHAFEDARKQNPEHPFNTPVYQGASVLVVGQNFGCGSSREHAPQALRRWGIAAVVGESFGEIFAGNCVAIGVPCLRVTEGDAALLQEAAEGDGARMFTVDLEEKTIRSGNLVVTVELPDGARAQFLDGTWDAMSVLLAAGPEIERTAARLPYLNGWA